MECGHGRGPRCLFAEVARRSLGNLRLLASLGKEDNPKQHGAHGTRKGECGLGTRGTQPGRRAPSGAAPRRAAKSWTCPSQVGGDRERVRKWGREVETERRSHCGGGGRTTQLKDLVAATQVKQTAFRTVLEEK